MLTILVLAQFALIAFLIWKVYAGYRAASQFDSAWDKLKAGFRDSLTVFWGWINAMSASAVSFTVLLSQVLDAPGMKEALAPFLRPEVMLVYVIVVSLGTILARMRTL